jgi:hypothetical protein
MCLRVGKLKEKKEKSLFFCILKVTEERSLIRSWIRSISQRYESVDLDPHQNVTDP